MPHGSIFSRGRSAGSVSVLGFVTNQIAACGRSRGGGPGRLGLAPNHEQPYADTRAVLLDNTDFATGSLQVASYARPGKLFTANVRLMSMELGRLKLDAFERVLEAVVNLFQAGD